MIQIPLVDSPSQTFTINVDAIEYSIRVIYNTRESTWSMDLVGPDFKIDGILLVGGVDILAQYPIDLKNAYMINVSGLTIDADVDNLGTEVVLIIATDEEIEGLIL